jgi:hypothetical protein
MKRVLLLAGNVAVLLALVIPWLNPFNSGPTPAVVPWLVSASCAVILGLLAARLTGQWVSIGWLIAAVVSATIGLMQYFGHIDVLGMWANSAHIGEAYANLRQRNQFATLTSVGLLATIWQLSQKRARPEPMTNSANPTCSNRMPIWCAGVILVMLAMGNAASGSRTGLLQWLAVGALAVLWRAPGQWRIPVVAFCALTAYGITAVGLPWVLHALTGVQSAGLSARFTEETGCTSRLVLWSNVLHLIAQKPWLGWGWGELDYAHFMTLYPGERFCDILDNAHNLPLHLAVEMGVPFALTVCGVLTWAVVRSRPWRETDPTRQLAWGVLAVITIHSLLEYPLWYGPFQIATLLSIGLLCKFLPTKATIAPVRSTLIATICIALIAWAGFDYWRVSQLYLPLSARSPAYQDNTLDKVRGSRLFSNQVAFAEFTTTALTPENAPTLYAMGLQLLHFSPEPRVVEKLIASADLLGLDDEAASYRVRYRAAFPDAYLRWMSDSAQDETP